MAVEEFLQGDLGTILDVGEGHDVLIICKAINTHANQQYFQAADDLRCCSLCFKQFSDDREYFLLQMKCMMSALVEIIFY